MVFLRPTIVRSKEDLADVSRQRYDALRDLSKPSPDRIIPCCYPRTLASYSSRLRMPR